MSQGKNTEPNKLRNTFCQILLGGSSRYIAYRLIFEIRRNFCSYYLPLRHNDVQFKTMRHVFKISLNPAINYFIFPDTSTVRQNLQITNLEILKNLSEWHYLYKQATKEKDEEKKLQLNDELESFELKLFSQQKSLK